MVRFLRFLLFKLFHATTKLNRINNKHELFTRLYGKATIIQQSVKVLASAEIMWLKPKCPPLRPHQRKNESTSVKLMSRRALSKERCEYPRQLQITTATKLLPPFK